MTTQTILRWTAALATAALLGTATVAALGDDRHFDRTEPGRGIDARSYYDDYEVPERADDGVSYSAAQAPGSDGSARSAGEEGGGEVPGLLEDNTFVDAGTAGFTDAGRDARSTFALDVDTGSWSVARTLLRSGLRPPPASIRPEEWVNAQAYADPAPTDADLGLVSETGAGPGANQLLRVSVGAREVAAADRPPVNVTLVVDRSGSMDIRERLGLVQSSLALLAGHLRDDDLVSVVSFDDNASAILEPTPVRETGKILDAIDDLRPDSSTNLEGGLRLGYEKARASYRPGAVNVVVLCSDGVANVGATGPGSILDTIEAEGRYGIHLVTVGYGMGNYNDHLMEQLADRGDGFYAYVDDFDEAERLFVHDLTTTLVPVAAEARAQVAFDPAAVASYRLVGYDNRAIADADFSDAGVDAGELGSGHRATALYELRLRPGVEPGRRLGTARVQWTSVPDGRVERASTPVMAADPTRPPSSSLALAATTADLARALKGVAPYDDGGAPWGGLAARADALVAADVPGAGQLAAMVDQARTAGD